jgi:PAS domain S-box-containing protein
LICPDYVVLYHQICTACRFGGYVGLNTLSILVVSYSRVQPPSVESQYLYFLAGILVTLVALCALLSVRKLRSHASTWSKKRFRALVSHVPGALYCCNPGNARSVDFVSEKVEDITGYPAGDFMSRRRTFTDIMDPADLETIRRYISSALEKKESYDLEYRLVSASGERRWVRDQGCGNYDKAGRLISVDGAFFDITSRRLAEEELQESRRMLEMQIAARTAELRRVNEQLRTQIDQRKKLEALVLRASEREQQRVGLELHEDIGQQLAGLAFMVSALSSRLVGKVPKEAGVIGDILELFQKTINGVRGAAKGLYPVEIRSGGLHTALEGLAVTTRERFGLSCVFTGQDDFEVHDASVATHVYRIAEEAITNAVRYARARNISIDLKRSDGHAILTMDTDGDGAGIDAVGAGAMGLEIMRYRAEAVGGVLEVASAPEGGTMVRCVFPNETDLFDGKAEW